LGEPRYIPEGAVLHASVIERLDSKLRYAPRNLPHQFVVEH
jgi:hypothetical protein